MADVTIDRLGKQGDGIAIHGGQEFYVPFSLPGERVVVSDTGKRRDLQEILVPSTARVSPVCTHFELCGGCQLQHMDNDTYSHWKTGLLIDELNRHAIEFTQDQMIGFDDAARRKVVFNVSRADTGINLGFSERASNTIVDVAECSIITPTLNQRMDDLRALCGVLPIGRKPIRVSVLDTGEVLDVSFSDLPKLSSKQSAALIRKAIELKFARLSVDDEILIEPRRPTLKMGMSEVTPPPGSFVQAIAEAETEMANLVCNHLGNCKTVADLFAGIGTFALRLAENSKVLAVEESGPALNALIRAWRETGGKLKEIKTEVRNLDRRPLNFKELKKIDGVVFDPPRAGAEAQAQQIAKSKVSKVAAVSCNPVTLVRDLQILLEGGFKLVRIVPVDQFKYTPHLEVVVLLER
ncbi:MAG: RNA methyltransferase [Pseudomonadota bacterium]